MIKRIVNLIDSYFKSKIPLIAFAGLKKRKNTNGRTSLNSTVFNYSNGNIFIEQYQHIFIEEIYNFFYEGEDAPVIIDAGGNIGMATLYFKKKYPLAKIIAFEPGKKEYDIFKKNIAENNLQEVMLHKAAIWINNNGISFSDTSDMSSKINPEGKNDIVDTVRLQELIQSEKRISFLKLDIEGAEVAVLMDCKDVLHQIDKIFIEYHSNPKIPQQLDVLLGLLTACGFRYYIKEDCLVTDKPYSKFKPKWGYDLQLQVFAYKTM